MDYNRLIEDINDPFAEVPSAEKFTALYNDVWAQRLEVAEVNQNMDAGEHSDPACQFELDQVIGRRGFDRRNNLMIDCLGRIVYCAGSVIVYMTKSNDANSDYQV